MSEVAFWGVNDDTALLVAFNVNIGLFVISYKLFFTLSYKFYSNDRMKGLNDVLRSVLWNELLNLSKTYCIFMELI